MQPQEVEAQMTARSHCLTVLMLTNSADVLRKKEAKDEALLQFHFDSTPRRKLDGDFHCEHRKISIWSLFFGYKSGGSGCISQTVSVTFAKQCKQMVRLFTCSTTTGCLMFLTEPKGSPADSNPPQNQPQRIPSPEDHPLADFAKKPVWECSRSPEQCLSYGNSNKELKVVAAPARSARAFLSLR